MSRLQELLTMGIMITDEQNKIQFDNFNSLMLMYGNEAKIVMTSNPSDGATLLLGKYRQKSLIVPEGVDNIENMGYLDYRQGNYKALDAQASSRSDSMLEQVILPTSLRTIGDRAFSNFKELKTIKVKPIDGQKLNRIGESAFDNCVSLSELDITGVVDIGECAFFNCWKLKNIMFKPSNIEYWAFGNSGVEKVNFDKTRHIGEGAYASTSLSDSIHLTDCTIDAYAFDKTKLTSVILTGDCKYANEAFGKNVQIFEEM